MKLKPIIVSCVTVLMAFILITGPTSVQARSLSQDTTTPPTDTVIPTDTPIPTGTETPVPPTATNTPLPPPPASATPNPSATDTPTETEEPTETPATDRPVLIIKDYSVDGDIRPGSEFSVTLRVKNTGQNNAYNNIFTFTSGDLIPMETGGTGVISQIIPGETRSLEQTFTVSTTVAVGTVVSVPVAVTYTDQSNGVSYSSSFNLSFTVGSYAGSGYPTATPTAMMRPQLVIINYSTDANTLQPGTEFQLKLEIRNLGTSNARGVTMVVGGGSAGDVNASGTPEASGVSGTGGDFSVFAPLHSSNIQYLGDLKTGDAIQAEQSLIVNVTASPGAYSPKFSFIYTDDKGVNYTDDQVITLLVYSLPMVDINFYQSLQPIFAGQPAALPLQIVNLGRKSVVLGNIEATVEQGEIQNGVSFIGSLDPGGYFPLDATLIATQAGTTELTVTVTYTDDFNVLRTIVEKFPLEVLDMPVEEPIIDGTEGMIEPLPVEETFWDKVVRFFKGMIGLDSSQPTSTGTDLPLEDGSMGGGGGGGGGSVVVPQKGP